MRFPEWLISAILVKFNHLDWIALYQKEFRPGSDKAMPAERLDFWWRSAFSAVIRHFFSERASVSA